MTLADFWQSHTLADVNGNRCRDYVDMASRPAVEISEAGADRQRAAAGDAAAARRELEDLRAAINHHRRGGALLGGRVVVLPGKSASRESLADTRSRRRD